MRVNTEQNIIKIFAAGHAILKVAQEYAPDKAPEGSKLLTKANIVWYRQEWSKLETAFNRKKSRGVVHWDSVYPGIKECFVKIEAARDNVASGTSATISWPPSLNFRVAKTMSRKNMVKDMDVMFALGYAILKVALEYAPSKVPEGSKLLTKNNIVWYRQEWSKLEDRYNRKKSYGIDAWEWEQTYPSIKKCFAYIEAARDNVAKGLVFPIDWPDRETYVKNGKAQQSSLTLVKNFFMKQVSSHGNGEPAALPNLDEMLTGQNQELVNHPVALEPDKVIQEQRRPLTAP